jgi:hypothetical protein
VDAVPASEGNAMTEQPIEVTVSQLVLIGLLILFVVFIVISHIAERDWRDRLNGWKDGDS